MPKKMKIIHAQLVKEIPAQKFPKMREIASKSSPKSFFITKITNTVAAEKVLMKSAMIADSYEVSLCQVTRIFPNTSTYIQNLINNKSGRKILVASALNYFAT